MLYIYVLVTIWANVATPAPVMFLKMNDCKDAAKIHRVDDYGQKMCLEIAVNSELVGEFVQ